MQPVRKAQSRTDHSGHQSIRPGTTADAGSRRTRTRRTVAPALQALIVRVIWSGVIATVVVTPLLIDPKGHDSFRLPKESFITLVGIIIIAVGLLALIFGIARISRTVLRDRVLLLIGAIVVWTSVSAMASTNRTISMQTLAYVVCLAAFTVAVYVIGRRAPLRAVMLMFIAAVPNCILYILQEFRIWNPLATKEQIDQAWFARHIFSSALIGNPDDVGGYLVPIALAAATLGVTAPTRRQKQFSIAAAVLFGGTVVATQSWGAIGAYTAALVTLFALTRRKPLRPILLASLLGIAVVIGYPPFRARLHTVVSTFAARSVDAYAIDVAFSNRLTPFAAAMGMFRDHPLTGVGPGCFGWHYYSYKVLFENAHPDMRKSATAYFNFGETHSDHLQTLAVSGLPGYALFWTAVVLVASCSWPKRESKIPAPVDGRSEFSRHFGLPFAVAFALHTVSQFPLELAAPMSQVLYAAGLCVAWRHDADS